MRIGILTGGGDCPGLNAVLRAVVKKGLQCDIEVLGILNGWKGLLDGEAEPLLELRVSGIIDRGGTLIGTSRTNPLKHPNGLQLCRQNWERYGLEGLIAVGGDDTLSVATKFHEAGLPVVGVPKTIDNDIPCTDLTFGFDTAVSIATEAIDRLHTTAESHQRIMVCEVMGRHAGWIATFAGLASGADCIIIPEFPMRMAKVAEIINERKRKGKSFSLVVIAEGAKPEFAADVIKQSTKLDEFGHVRLGGVGHLVAEEIERLTGVETRVTILGHVQRGGTPTAFDRILATRFGLAAVDLVLERQWGMMVALRGNEIVRVPLKEATATKKLVPRDWFALAEVFFG